MIANTNQPESAGQCRCCRETRRLRLSHVISRLAYRRLKRFPGQNRLVHGLERRVVQDGPKRYLLCDDCEQRLGVAERLFNDRFFIPYYKVKRFRVEYRDWLAKFVAANLWRILITSLEDGMIPVVLQEQTTETERVWRGFIRSERVDCAPHDLHLIAIDNRPERSAYAEGAVDQIVLGNKVGPEAYLVAKVPGLAIIGILRQPHDRSWEGTRINPVGGFFDARVEFRCPDLLASYLRRQILLANQGTKVEWN